MSKFQASVLFSSALILSGCAAFTEHSTGVMGGKLTPCPAWPRCRSSDSELVARQVPPLLLPASQISANQTKNWAAIKAVVAQIPRTTIVKEHYGYLHAEIESPWGWYTDDLELLLRPEQGHIAVRSSGRIGYYDFDVNLERIEALRAELVKQGLIQP